MGEPEIVADQRLAGAKLFVTETLTRNSKLSPQRVDSLRQSLGRAWMQLEVDVQHQDGRVPMGEVDDLNTSIPGPEAGGSDEVLRAWGVISEEAQSSDGRSANIDEFEQLKNLIEQFQQLDRDRVRRK